MLFSDKEVSMEFASTKTFDTIGHATAVHNALL